MHPKDSLQKFLFEHADIRGEIVHIDKSFKTILQQHQYPQIIHHLLGEALVASVLLAATIKFKGSLTMQFQSDGALKMLVAKCNHKFHIRGLAQFDEDNVSHLTNAHSLLGDGQLIVTIQADDNPNPYQSIIPLHNEGIAKSLEHYFAQSEQLATKIWLAVGDQHAAGVLLQMLPEKISSQEREIFWEHAVKLGETLTEKELFSLSNETILHRLYHEEDIRLFEENEISFRCTCDRHRMENAIRMFGEQEAMEILAEKQVITVLCEFCNNEFSFDRVDVVKIFQK